MRIEINVDETPGAFIILSRLKNKGYDINKVVAAMVCDSWLRVKNKKKLGFYNKK